MSRESVGWREREERVAHELQRVSGAAVRSGRLSSGAGAGWFWAALPVVLLAAASCGGVKPQAAASAPLTSVAVVKAIQMDVPLHAEWVATLEGYVNAQIQPQVSGYLISQNYQEGSYVRKGDVLFQIDPRPFQAVLDQAKGQLAQARAQLYLAEVNVKRDTPLVKERAIAQSQLDTEMAAEMQARASIQAAEASVEQAQLNLGIHPCPLVGRRHRGNRHHPDGQPGFALDRSDHDFQDRPHQSWFSHQRAGVPAIHFQAAEDGLRR